MTLFQSFVGVDIASASLMACVGIAPWKLTVKPMKFSNDEEGFVSFLSWLKEHNLQAEPTVVCMEATGVFLARQWLYRRGRATAQHPAQVSCERFQNG